MFITQVIYIHPGKEKEFDQFESVAIPIISKYNGKLLLRLRPAQSSVIEKGMEVPYELHLVSFDSEENFERFMHDEERKSYLHLKEAAIREVLLIKGNLL